MKTMSVIIVNYNGRKFLERLFASISVQTFSDFEVIFVDNESKDNSVDFVKKNYPSAKIILSYNLGYGTGCNLGAKSATGKYLIFLNEDMYLPEDFLKKMLTYYQALPNQDKIGGVSCRMVNFNTNPDLSPSIFGARMDILGFPYRNNDCRKIFIISGSPFFIMRNLFEKVGEFNEMIFIYGEDVDLSWRLNIFGYENYICNEAFIYHYGGGATGNFSPKKVANVVYGGFIPVFTNYSLGVLFFILPLFAVFSSLFYLLIIILKFDRWYFIEIIKKQIFFFKNLKKALRIRMFVQKNRVKDDFYLVKYISIMPAFLTNRSAIKLSKNYLIKNC